jgi:anti-sigma B factor antagonist
VKYTVTEKDAVVLIKLDGGIVGGPDARTLHEFIRDLNSQKKNKIILDLSSVTLMNSSGLGIIISSLTTVRNSQGDIVLVKVPERIKHLLTITKLISVFKLFDTAEQAEAHLKVL